MKSTTFNMNEKHSFRSLKHFLNSSNRNNYSLKFPLLDTKGGIEGYCIQKYDRWCHLIEETYFDAAMNFMLKIMITNDLSGNPLRKDIFDAHGQRLPHQDFHLKAS